MLWILLPSCVDTYQQVRHAIPSGCGTCGEASLEGPRLRRAARRGGSIARVASKSLTSGPAAVLASFTPSTSFRPISSINAVIY